MVFSAMYRVFTRPCRPGTRRRLDWSVCARRRSTLLCELLEERSLLSTYTVTDLGDAGTGLALAGDLRYCLNQANVNQEPANQIVFDPSLTGTLTLIQGELAITKDVNIAGPGAAALTISANHQSRVFDITGDPGVQTVQLSDLTIADGIGGPVPGGQGGGGLYNAHATVTLNRVVVSGNRVTAPGTDFGGGLYNDAGTLILQSSTVSDNTVGNGGQGGGLYDRSGTMVLDSSTVSKNHAGIDGFGGGLAAGDSGGAPVLLHNCTIAANTVAGTLGAGGGIENIGGQMTIDHCLISGNSSDYIAGGLFNVGATLSITDSQITGNFATRGGSGLYNNNARLTMTNSTISGNTSSPTAGFGGGIGNNSQMTLSGCTITGNRAFDGGGISQQAGVMRLMDCTISENAATRGGGGIFVNQGDLGILELTSVTITANSAGSEPGFESGGGGLWLYPVGIIATNRTYLNNTLVAGNSSATTGVDVMGTVRSVGFNLIGQADGSQGWDSTDILGTSVTPLDPLLGPLQDNGGPTWTHALLAGSPAFESGDLALRETLDQRGTERIGSHRPDIGAFQAERIFSFQVTAPSEVAPGEPFSVTVTALDFDGHTASTFVGGVQFASTDSAGLLPSDYTFTATDGGVHTFTITLQTPGPQTIQAIDVGNHFHRGTAMVAVEEPPGGSPPGAFAEILLFWETEAGRRRP